MDVDWDQEPSWTTSRFFCFLGEVDADPEVASTGATLTGGAGRSASPVSGGVLLLGRRSGSVCAFCCSGRRRWLVGAYEVVGEGARKRTYKCFDALFNWTWITPAASISD